MIYFTSDQHFGHINIVKNLGQGRPFYNVDHMNSCIRANWFEVVRPEDVVYVLGDSAMGSFEETILLFADLPGEKLFIPGNHDKIGGTQSFNRNKTFRPLYEEVGFQILDDITSIGISTSYGNQEVLLSHYPYSESCGRDNAEARRDKFRKVRPINEGLPLIHGHTHSSERFDAMEPLQFHVGVDANNFTPVPLTDVQVWLESLKADGVL